MIIFDISSLLTVQKPEIAYILGFLWADGHITKRVGKNSVTCTISEKDGESMDVIFQSTNLPWRQYLFTSRSKKNNGKKYRTFTICNESYKEFFVQHNYLLKSGGSPISILNHIPEKLRHYWWRGYFDGDGCMYFKKHHGASLQVGSTIDQDWIFFEKLCDELGITYRVDRTISDTGSCSIFILRNEYAIRTFCDYIYQGMSFGLTRKYEIYKEFLSWKDIKKSNSTSKYRGVHWDKNKNRWIMQSRAGGEHHYECFLDQIDAAKRYDELARRLRPNKVVLNFP